MRGLVGVQNPAECAIRSQTPSGLVDKLLTSLASAPPRHARQWPPQRQDPHCSTPRLLVDPCRPERSPAAATSYRSSFSLTLIRSATTLGERLHSTNRDSLRSRKAARGQHLQPARSKFHSEPSHGPVRRGLENKHINRRSTSDPSTPSPTSSTFHVQVSPSISSAYRTDPVADLTKRQPARPASPPTPPY